MRGGGVEAYKIAIFLLYCPSSRPIFARIRGAGAGKAPACRFIVKTGGAGGSTLADELADAVVVGCGDRRTVWAVEPGGGGRAAEPSRLHLYKVCAILSNDEVRF